MAKKPCDGSMTGVCVDFPACVCVRAALRANEAAAHRTEYQVKRNQERENGAVLTFNALREANTARLPQFKNSKGGKAHSKADGSDWSRADWLEAVVGELGEYSNFSKKFRRGDIDAEEFKKHAEKELADVVTYLDILAKQLGIDLGAAVMRKFNEVSDRVGSEVYFDHTGAVRYGIERGHL